MAATNSAAPAALTGSVESGTSSGTCRRARSVVSGVLDAACFRTPGVPPLMVEPPKAAFRLLLTASALRCDKPGTRFDYRAGGRSGIGSDLGVAPVTTSRRRGASRPSVAGYERGRTAEPAPVVSDVPAALARAHALERRRRCRVRGARAAGTQPGRDGSCGRKPAAGAGGPALSRARCRHGGRSGRAASADDRVRSHQRRALRGDRALDSIATDSPRAGRRLLVC